MPADDGMLTFRGYRIAPRVTYIALAALGSLGVAMLYTFDPRNPGTYPICPFLGLTGYHCPGCGTLRALHQLLHGNVIGAMGYNPIIPVYRVLVCCRSDTRLPCAGTAPCLYPARVDLGVTHRHYRVLGAAKRTGRSVDGPCAIGSLQARASLEAGSGFLPLLAQSGGGLGREPSEMSGPPWSSRSAGGRAGCSPTPPASVTLPLSTMVERGPGGEARGREPLPIIRPGSAAHQ